MCKDTVIILYVYYIIYYIKIIKQDFNKPEKLKDENSSSEQPMVYIIAKLKL